MTRLRQVGQEEEFIPPQAAEPAQPNVSLQLLLLALKTLGQRTILALAALRGLVLAGTVFWLSLVVVENPSAAKLTGLGIYAVFVLLGEFMVNRRK